MSSGSATPWTTSSLNGGERHINPDVAYFAPALSSATSPRSSANAQVPLHSLTMAALPPPNLPVSHAMSVLAATHNPSHNPFAPAPAPSRYQAEVSAVARRGLPVFSSSSPLTSTAAGYGDTAQNGLRSHIVPNSGHPSASTSTNTSTSTPSTATSHTSEAASISSVGSASLAKLLAAVPLVGSLLSYTGILPSSELGISNLSGIGKNHSGEMLSDLEFLRKTGAISGLTSELPPHTIWDKISLAYFRTFQATRNFFRDIRHSSVPLFLTILFVAYKARQWTRKRRDIRDRNIVVTGADTALGALVGVEIAKRGARVVLWGRSAAKLALTRAAVLHHVPSAQVFVYAVDVADSYALTLLAQRCIEEIGFLYGLVHLPCAHPAWKPMGKLRTRDVAMTTADAHLLTWSLRALVPEMIEKREGLVISLVADADGTVARPLGDQGYEVYGGNALNSDAHVLSALRRSMAAGAGAATGADAGVGVGAGAGATDDGTGADGSVSDNSGSDGSSGSGSGSGSGGARKKSLNIAQLSLDITNTNTNTATTTADANVAASGAGSGSGSGSGSASGNGVHRIVSTLLPDSHTSSHLFSSSSLPSASLPSAFSTLDASQHPSSSPSITTATAMSTSTSGPASTSTSTLPAHATPGIPVRKSNGTVVSTLYPQPDISLEVKPTACLDPMLVPFLSAQKALSGVILAGKTYIRNINHSPEDPLNGYTGVSDGKIDFSQVRVGFRTDTHTAARGILRALDFGEDVDTSDAWSMLKRTVLTAVELLCGADARVACAEALCTLERVAAMMSVRGRVLVKVLMAVLALMWKRSGANWAWVQGKKIGQRLGAKMSALRHQCMKTAMGAFGKQYVVRKVYKDENWPLSARADKNNKHVDKKMDVADSDDRTIPIKDVYGENGEGRKMPIRNFAYVGKDAVVQIPEKVVWRDGKDTPENTNSEGEFSIFRPARKITWHDDFFPGVDSKGFPVCPKYTYDLNTLANLPEVRPPAYPYYLAQHDVAMYRLCGLTNLKATNNGNAPISPLARGSLLEAKEELHARRNVESGITTIPEKENSEEKKIQQTLPEFYSHGTTLFGMGTPEVNSTGIHALGTGLGLHTNTGRGTGTLSNPSSLTTTNNTYGHTGAASTGHDGNGNGSGQVGNDNVGKNTSMKRPEGLPTGMKVNSQKPEGLSGKTLFADIPFISRNTSSGQIPDLTKSVSGTPVIPDQIPGKNTGSGSYSGGFPMSPVRPDMYQRFIKMDRENGKKSEDVPEQKNSEDASRLMESDFTVVSAGDIGSDEDSSLSTRKKDPESEMKSQNSGKHTSTMADSATKGGKTATSGKKGKVRA